MRRPAVVVAIVLAVGVAGTAIALQSREGNSQFVDRQQAPLPVSAAGVERLLLSTSDPRPARSGRARAAHCSQVHPGAGSERWSCLVLYPRSPRMSYSVDVRGDRSIRGVGRSRGASGEAASTVSGCCVGAP